MFVVTNKGKTFFNVKVALVLKYGIHSIIPRLFFRLPKKNTVKLCIDKKEKKRTKNNKRKVVPREYFFK